MEGTDRCTCFVRNIATDVALEQITELFGEVGPVKNAFIIGDKGSGSHKGYGFVTFALPADAQAAVTKLANHKLAGKRLQVEAAQKRKPLKDRNAAKKPTEDETADGAEPDAAPAAASKPSKPHGGITAELKAALNRAVAVGGFQDGQEAAAMKLAKAAGSTASIEPEVPQAIAQFAKLSQDGCDGRALLVYYSSVKAAVAAVAKLHRQPIDSAKDKANLWARQVKRWRIIIRNLPFGISETALIEFLSPSGFVWMASIPKFADGRMKGFGFACFTCKAHAAHAIDAVNGKKFKGRVLVADWSLSKHEYSGAGGTAEPTAGAAAAEDAGAAAADDDAGARVAREAAGGAPREAESEESAGASGEAGPAEHGSDESASTEHAAGGEDAEMRAEEKDMYRAVLGGLLGEETAAGEAGAEGDAAPERAAQAGHGGKGEKGERRKPREAGAVAAAEGEGRTAEWEGERAEEPEARRGGSGVIDTQVFVRGLPADVTSVELTARMSRYGDVKQCRLVVNKSTGKPKGTAFAQFMEAQAAQKACAACARQRDGKGEGVSLRGKALSIDAALVQDSARALAQSAQGAGGKPAKGQDRRNLYLVRRTSSKQKLTKEGRIEPGSELWAQLSPADQAKREAAVKEAGLKLKSPNFLVSPTRLRVLNVPLTWDSKQLKTCCHKAVLTRATKAKPTVTQCIVLRDKEKVDGTGQPRSRGCAFVEFESAEHALVCLRQMNNNPNLFGGAQRRPIVEFAIDSVKALKIQARKQRLIAERQAQRSMAEVAPEEEEQQAQAVPGKASKRTKKRKRGDDGPGAEKAGGGDVKGGGADADQQKAKSRKQRSRPVKPAEAEKQPGGEKHKSVQMANTQVGAAKRTIVVADAQNRSAPRPKPVLEAPKSKRKKHKAANTDDLDRVLSSRSAALFGNKTLQLDSKWFD